MEQLTPHSWTGWASPAGRIPLTPHPWMETPCSAFTALRGSSKVEEPSKGACPPCPLLENLFSGLQGNTSGLRNSGGELAGGWALLSFAASLSRPVSSILHPDTYPQSISSSVLHPRVSHPVMTLVPTAPRGPQHCSWGREGTVLFHRRESLKALACLDSVFLRWHQQKRALE